MELETVIGIAASFFTTLSLVPQLLKLHREKKPQNVSMGMLGVLLAGLVFWIVYGVMKEDGIIIAANALSLAINIGTIVLVHRYKTDDHEGPGEKNGNRLRRHYP